MKKINYLCKNADKNTVISAVVAAAMVVATILLLVVSLRTAFTTPITELPLIELVVPKSERDSMDDEFEQIADEIRYAIKYDDEDLLDEIESEFGMSAEELLDVLDPLTFNTIKVMADTVETDEDVRMGLQIVANAFTYYIVFIGILVVLAGLFMNKALFIIANVLSVSFFLAFVGAVWFVVFLVLCVVFCIFASKVNSSYKKYIKANQA